jgi:hypothetical protein
MNAHTLTEALRLARRAVKDQWRKQNSHWWDYDTHELANASRAYLSEHFDELVEKAARRLNEIPK